MGVCESLCDTALHNKKKLYTSISLALSARGAHLIGRSHHVSQPGDLRLQLPNDPHARVLVHHRRVDDVFSSVSIAQGAKSLSVVDISWGKGCEDQSHIPT